MSELIIKNVIHKYKSVDRDWNIRDVSDIKIITIHHTVIDHDLEANYRGDKLLQFIQDIHQKKNWPGLAYHFVIDKNGTIYQTNNYTDITWHDSINYDSIGIAVDGYFHPNDKGADYLTDEQQKSLRMLLDHLCKEHPEFPADEDDVWGHGERTAGTPNATACPGSTLLPLVQEYRNKKGDVSWGNYLTVVPEPIKEPEKEEVVINEEVKDDKIFNLVKDIKTTINEKMSSIEGQVRVLSDKVNDASTRISILEQGGADAKDSTTLIKPRDEVQPYIPTPKEDMLQLKNKMEIAFKGFNLQSAGLTSGIYMTLNKYVVRIVRYVVNGALGLITAHLPIVMGYIPDDISNQAEIAASVVLGALYYSFFEHLRNKYENRRSHPVHKSPV